MEYSIEMVRLLVKRWLAGETTLAQERILREFFGHTQGELPADLQLYRPMFGQCAEAAGEKSRRKLALRIEPANMSGVAGVRREGKERKTATGRALNRRIAAAVGVAAVAVGVVMLTVPERSRADEIICLVNGVRITDPDKIAAFTREAFEIAGRNLQKPHEAISSSVDGGQAMTRVGEMLEMLAGETENRN